LSNLSVARNITASPEDDPDDSQMVNGPLGQGHFRAGSEFNTTTRVFKTVCGLRRAKAMGPLFSLRICYHARASLKLIKLIRTSPTNGDTGDNWLSVRRSLLVVCTEDLPERGRSRWQRRPELQ